MSRIYISGSISNTTDYIERFTKAQEKLEKQEYEVVNPAISGTTFPAFTYEEHMTVDIALLGLCDGIYMLKGWEQSRGANREYGFALGKGMEIMFEDKEEAE